MTRLLSNLIKSNYIYFDERDKRVIDSRSKDNLFQPEIIVNEKTENQDNHNFEPGISAVSLDITTYQEDIKQKENEILESANQKALQIITEAVISSNVEKENIFDQAKRDGYVAGYEEGQKEVTKIKNDLEEKKVDLVEAYEEQIKELEPTCVELIINYLRKLTGIMATEHKDIIRHLINQALLGDSSSENYTIKVSKEDYPFVSSHQDQITESFKNDAKLEIIEDNSLTKNQCLIVTDNRIIDCSLDVQLDNLITDLKILSQSN